MLVLVFSLGGGDSDMDFQASTVHHSSSLPERKADHVCLRHLSVEYWPILSPDILTDSRLTYRPIHG